MNVNDDLEKLIENLPFSSRTFESTSYKDQLIEIVLDLGRRPEARFVTGPEYLSQKIISWQDIDYMTKRLVNLVMKIELELNEHFIE
jgi:stage III sporulation protein SpoIIIAA